MILLYTLFILGIFSFNGCVQGVKTGVVQKADYAYLKFTGNLDSASVIIDDGKYSFDLFTYYNDPTKKRSLYKISKGKHRIQVYKNDILVVDRTIFVDNHVTMEIDIPWNLNHTY